MTPPREDNYIASSNCSLAAPRIRRDAIGKTTPSTSSSTSDTRIDRASIAAGDFDAVFRFGDNCRLVPRLFSASLLRSLPPSRPGQYEPRQVARQTRKGKGLSSLLFLLRDTFHLLLSSLSLLSSRSSSLLFLLSSRKTRNRLSSRRRAPPTSGKGQEDLFLLTGNSLKRKTGFADFSFSKALQTREGWTVEREHGR